ncbi:hypothetical protein BH20PSE1_BH20PSE1_09370 [soil metagenome]
MSRSRAVTQNALVPEATVNVSLLAELDPKTAVPGVIGYFQIEPDGSFHSNLPEHNVVPAQLDERLYRPAIAFTSFAPVPCKLRSSRGSRLV